MGGSSSPVGKLVGLGSMAAAVPTGGLSLAAIPAFNALNAAPQGLGGMMHGGLSGAATAGIGYLGMPEAGGSMQGGFNPMALGNSQSQGSMIPPGWNVDPSTMGQPSFNPMNFGMPQQHNQSMNMLGYGNTMNGFV